MAVVETVVVEVSRLAAARRYIIFVSFREEMAHAQLYNGFARSRGKPFEKFSPIK